MRMVIRLIVLSVVLCFATSGITAQEKMELPPYVGTAEFEQLKSLVGSWEGIHKTGETEDPAEAIYEITSNGSAIVETLFPGTEHEMVTVYYDKGGKLAMTHYCAFGNRPEMKLTAAGEGIFNFSLDDNSETDVASEGHMHALKITVVDKNTITHNWTMYQEGSEAGETIIELSRVSE